MINNFEDLEVWQKSHKFTLSIYKITKGFPESERFGITNQLRRASVSIGNNIAEGFGRHTTKDFINFLHKSLGSLYECYSMLRLSVDLSYISMGQYKEFYDLWLSVKMMLKKLIGTLERKVVSNL